MKSYLYVPSRIIIIITDVLTEFCINYAMENISAGKVEIINRNSNTEMRE